MPELKNNTYIFKNNDEREIEKFVGIDGYSTNGYNGIGGRYKYVFKDFIVKEIIKSGEILEIKEDYESPPFNSESKDKYTTFNLVKINRETFEALREISYFLKIPLESIYYSGLKDKCAITVQRISIYGDHIESLKKLKIHDLFFRNIVPTKKRVKLGSNWGNFFTIIIRDLDDKEGELEEKIKQIFNNLIKFGFPNYFGLQRFGMHRPNSHIVGRYLLEKKYENAFHEFVSVAYSMENPEIQKIRTSLKEKGDIKSKLRDFPKSMVYERLMLKYLIEHPDDYEGTFNALPFDLKTLLISAFQSYIFNKMVSLRLQKGFSFFKPTEGDVLSILDDDNGHITRVKYKYGGLYDEYLRKAIKLNRAVIIVPIVGYDTNLDEFPLMKNIFEEILKKEKINKNIFKSELLYRYDFKGTFRALTVKPIGLKFIHLKNDDIFPGKKKLKFEFSLPKGSYATMLLRELMK
ncbi:MAG: tRNA pseudouridine(13) synthase TruD [Promethearchaeota archaeon]